MTCRISAVFAALALAVSGISPQLVSAATPKPKAHKAASHPAAAAPAPSENGIDTQAKHAYIVDLDTGAVLLDKAGEERMPPASMSKMMTAYVIFSMLKDGHAKLTDELPVSERAWRTGGSRMFVPLGARIPIDELLKGLIIDSGNDACVVLAEGLAGSVDAFVQLMNEKAKKIGLKDSHFDNVDGLPDPDHWMTAQDLATLATRTIKDFPQYYKLYSQIDFTFNSIRQGNRNPLLYKNVGADGLKTGHTQESGYSLTASVVRGDRRIVMVLNGLPTMRARAQESERLTDWAFREFKDYHLFSPGDRVEEAQAWLGAAPLVPLTVTRNVVVTLPRAMRKQMKVTLQYDAPIPAPIEKGETVGKLVVDVPGMAPVEAPLVAAAPVARMDAAGRVATLAGYLVWGNRH